MVRRWVWSGVIALVGAGVALGVLTALHACLGGLAAFDLATQAWVHGWASPQMTAVMLALTGLGATVSFLPAVTLVGARMMAKGDRQRAALLGFAVAGALALNEGLKTYFHRARPVVVWAMAHERTYSFPSGHALFAATLYGVLLWLGWREAGAKRRGGLAATAVALMVGIGASRVYLGVHWPTDVLAGYAVGGIWMGTVMAVERVWKGSSSAWR